jgi:hypothetical protein
LSRRLNQAIVRFTGLAVWLQPSLDFCEQNSFKKAALASVLMYTREVTSLERQSSHAAQANGRAMMHGC